MDNNMNRHLCRFLAYSILIAPFAAAQGNKGQTPTAQQPASTQQQNIPPQLYPLERLPKTRNDALDSLATSSSGTGIQRKVGNLARKSTPRFVWYRPVISKSESGSTASAAIPLTLDPMTCQDWTASERGGEFGNDFKVCGEKNRFKTPSIPTQNINPLELGDSLIIAIYDPDELLEKYGVTLIGMTVNAQAGTVLSTDPLRPVISTSGSSSGGGGAANTAGNPSKGLAPAAAGFAPPPAKCSRIQFVAPALLEMHPEESRTLKVAVTADKIEGLKVTFSVPKNQPTGKLAGGAEAVEVKSDENYPKDLTRGIAEINLQDLSGTGRFEIKASCKDSSDNFMTDSLIVDIIDQTPRHFYFLPWANNPVQGDTVLSVAITAQAPTPVPLVVTADPADQKLPISVGDALAISALTKTFASGSVVRVRANDEGNYHFVRWSDGGNRSHAVAIGSAPLTLVAEYAKTDDRVPVVLLSNPAGASLDAKSEGSGGADCFAGSPSVFSCPLGGSIIASAPAKFSGSWFQRWSDGEPTGNCPTGNCVRVTPGKEPVTLIAIYAKLSAPETGTIALGTNPPGLLAKIGDLGHITPQLVEAAPSDVSFPATQQDGYVSYSFAAAPTQQQGNGISSISAEPTHSNVSGKLSIATSSTGPSQPGLFVNVKKKGETGNGAYLKGGSVVDSSLGETVTVDATLKQVSNGITYVFQKWSDGGGASHDVTVGKDERTLTAVFSADSSPAYAPPSIPAAVPVTVTTDPPGLAYSVNGILHPASFIGYFQPGSSLALNTPTPQSVAGTSYIFSGWSDGANNSAPAHSFSLSGGGNANAGNPSPGGGSGSPGGGNNNQSPPPYASITAAFAVSAPSEETLNLLNATYHQTHNLSRYNVATGMIYSTLRSPSWTRQEVAAPVTCPVGSPQPCVPSPALYQTVPNPPSSHAIDPVLFFMVYLKRLDSERKWHPSDMIPALNLGLSLSSPATDYFFGLSSEVFFRGVQIVGGRHIGKVNELAPPGVNDPTSSAAPAIVTRFHPAWYFGLTFNINFIQSLFSPGKSGG